MAQARAPSPFGSLSPSTRPSLLPLPHCCRVLLCPKTLCIPNFPSPTAFPLPVLRPGLPGGLAPVCKRFRASSLSLSFSPPPPPNFRVMKPALRSNVWPRPRSQHPLLHNTYLFFLSHALLAYNLTLSPLIADCMGQP